jgi:hypothetical protein
MVMHLALHDAARFVLPALLARARGALGRLAGNKDFLLFSGRDFFLKEDGSRDIFVDVQGCTA